MSAERHISPSSLLSYTKKKKTSGEVWCSTSRMGFGQPLCCGGSPTLLLQNTPSATAQFFKMKMILHWRLPQLLQALRLQKSPPLSLRNCLPLDRGHIPGVSNFRPSAAYLPHFPMQKSLKMTVRISSAPSCPVSCPRCRRAWRKSSAARARSRCSCWTKRPRASKHLVRLSR